MKNMIRASSLDLPCSGTASSASEVGSDDLLLTDWFISDI